MKRLLMTMTAIGVLAAGTVLAQTATQPQRRLARQQALRGMAKQRGVAGATAVDRQQALRAQLQKRMMNSLGLTDAQKEQAKSIRQATQQNAQALTQQLKQNRQALAAAVQAGDLGKIEQLSADIGNLQGHVLAIRSTGRAKVMALLTPEQKAKAAAFRQKAQEVLGGRLGKQ